MDNKVGFATKLIIGILVICFAMASILDVLVDVADAVVDASSAGVLGAVTGIFDTITEVVVGLLQVFIIFLINHLVTTEKFKVGYKLTVLLTIIEFVISAAMIVIPFGDIAEVFLEIAFEFAKNMLVLDTMIKILIFA